MAKGSRTPLRRTALRRRRQLLRPLPVSGHLLAVHPRPEVGLSAGWTTWRCRPAWSTSASVRYRPGRRSAVRSSSCGRRACPTKCVAVGPSGVSVRQAFVVYSSFDRVELAGLWPGHWIVSARSGDEVLAMGEVDVKGTGTFHGDPDDRRRPGAVTPSLTKPDLRPKARDQTFHGADDSACGGLKSAGSSGESRPGASGCHVARTSRERSPSRFVALHGDHVTDIVPILGPIGQHRPV